jgi:osmotically-inducible protein OsmY
MKTDAEIQKDVVARLKWDPLLNAAEIDVSVEDGVAILSGRVDSYSKRLNAEKAAKEILGVKAVVEDIQVGVSPVHRRSDDKIFAAIHNAVKWHMVVQQDRIRIKVEHGVVTLDGEVDWNHQRQAIVDTIGNLPGIVFINDHITVKEGAAPGEAPEFIF